MVRQSYHLAGPLVATGLTELLVGRRRKHKAGISKQRAWLAHLWEKDGVFKEVGGSSQVQEKHI